MNKKAEPGHVNGKHRAAVEYAISKFQAYESWKSVKPTALYVSDLGDNRVFLADPVSAKPAKP